MNAPKRYLSVTEFAAAVGVSRLTIRKRIMAGTLAAVEEKTGPIGFRYVVPVELVATYTAGHPRTEARRQARLAKGIK